MKSLFMFITLFILARSDTIGIDCGSFFTKSSITKPFNNPTVGLYHQSKRAVPSFLAFRAKPAFNFNVKSTLSEGESELLTPEFGERALTAMDFRPWMGSGYFSFLAGTDNKSLSQNLHVNMTAARVKYNDLIPIFLSFYMKGVYGSNFTNVSEVTLVFPATATIDQRLIFERGLESLGIFNHSSIDDVDAISYAYTLEKISKFSKKANQVLFVDIGSTSVKSYVVKFELSNKKPKATRLSYSIRYETGGSYITNGIVDSMISKFGLDREITVAERQRLFTAAEKIKKELTILNQSSVIVENVDGLDFEYKMLRKELEELPSLSEKLTSAVKEVIDEATKNSNIAFDEIELIGGSSRIPIIQSHLQSIINQIPKHGKTTIGHSLNADETLAIGAGYYSQYLQNQSQYQPIEIIDQYPIYTIIIKEFQESTNKQEYIVCTRGERCINELTVNGSTTRVDFYTQPFQLPLGVSKASLFYEVEPTDGTTTRIKFVHHPTRISSISQCKIVKQKETCVPFKKFNISNGPSVSNELVHLFVDANAREEHIARTRHEIEELATRVLKEIDKNASVRFFTNHSQRIEIIRVAEKMKKWSLSPEAASCKNLLNFTTRLSELKRSIGPVYVRIRDNHSFYEAAQELQMMSNFMSQAAEQASMQAPNMNKDIMAQFKGKIASTKHWLLEALKKNQNSPAYLPLPVKARQFQEKRLEIKALFDKVMEELQRTPRDPNFQQNREKFLKMEEEKALKKMRQQQRDEANKKKASKNDEI